MIFRSALKKEEDFNVLLQQDLSSERLGLERRRNPFSHFKKTKKHAKNLY